jgi:hypothetical protein
LELKRLQIRAGRANEQVLVKRLVDDYHKAGLTVGMRQYDGVFTFRNFEKYLYGRLRHPSNQFLKLPTKLHYSLLRIFTSHSTKQKVAVSFAMRSTVTQVRAAAVS